MKLRVFLCSLLFGSLFTSPVNAAADNIGQLGDAEISARFTSETDPYVGYEMIEGPEVTFEDPHTSRWTWSLRAIKSSKGKVFSVSMFGFVSYDGDWRIYNNAWYLGGEQAAFEKGKQGVIACHGSCILSETFRVTIPIERIFAKDASISGISIKIVGGGPDLYANIPANYVRAFQAKVQPFIEGYTEDK